MTTEELRTQLETLQRSHDALLKSIAVSNGSFGLSTSDIRAARRASGRDERNIDTANAVFVDSSTVSDHSDEENETYFVQEELPSQSFDHEHLREHLKKHDFGEHGREILSAIITDRGRLKQPHLFPSGAAAREDRSHYSHYQVYDVDAEGNAQLIERNEDGMSRAVEIWHSIKDINAEHSKSRKAVGRITIAREPSPILFGALHLTMNTIFDMDELFRHLVRTDSSSADMHRAFSEELRHQKTFFFNFEYYTIIGEDCKPMQWQMADNALALYDSNPRRIKNRGRRAKTKYGWVQDIWSPWQVLNLQCFPDWRATTDTFESGHRYLNGVEAFLYALLAEYRDAIKRYQDIYKRISLLITPPIGFIFDSDMRDQRLFEDKTFTWTRRYFWAHQTLGNVNDSIKSMIDAFEGTFTEEVWEGKSNTLWPLFEESPRNDHWKRRLRMLRFQFEREMKELRTLMRENNDRRIEIASLQNHIFSGTSIQESRRSVELADTTVQQGRNIKLLTLVNLFFMPLTFTTSVFGMTNMSTEPQYWQFGVTLATVCVPFFALVGFLNTDLGYRLWHDKTRAAWQWLRLNPKPKGEAKEKEFTPSPVGRTLSTEEGMRLRLGQGLGQVRSTTSPRLSHPNIKNIVEAVNEVSKNESRAMTDSTRIVENK